MFHRLLAPVIALVLVGCGSTKEFVPISPAAVSPRIPNQQRLIATALNQAVAAAMPGLNLAQFAGRSGTVEVNGVFPHSADDLLHYVRSAVEWEMARAGMLVLPRQQHTPHVTLKVPDEDGVKGKAPWWVPANAEVQVVASLDWSGIDYTDKKYIVGGKVAGMVVVGLLTFGVGAVIWAIADKPTAHIFTLDGRVRLTLRAIPAVAGLRAAQSSGEGTSRIVIDTESDSGYALQLAVPEKSH